MLKGVLTRRHRPALPAGEPSGRRQDRHAGGQHQRLVRRLHARADDVGVGRRPQRLHADGEHPGVQGREPPARPGRSATRRRSGRRTWTRRYAVQPVSDWEAPPADARPPARLYLPGNECLGADRRLHGRRGRADRDHGGRPPPGSRRSSSLHRWHRRRPRRRPAAAAGRAATRRRGGGDDDHRRRSRRHHAAGAHLRAARERARRSRPTCSTRASRCRRHRCRVASSGADRRPAGAPAPRHDRRPAHPPPGPPRRTGAADAATAAVRDAERRRHAERRRGSTSWSWPSEALEATGSSSTQAAHPAGGAAADGHRAARGRGVDARAGRRSPVIATSSTTRSWPTWRSSPSWPTTIARLDDAAGPARHADAARAVLAAVESDIDAAAGRARRRRGCAVAAGIDAVHVERYERLRARFGGVAVARLDGKRCGGCHLDLSRGELDEVRAVGARASSPTARSAAGCSCPDPRRRCSSGSSARRSSPCGSCSATPGSTTGC